MRACREGGTAIEQALRRLDREFFAVLFARARRIIRDADAARDLVQDAFIKVWQRCATYQGTSELLPWIEAILRHGVLDALRRSGREVAFDVTASIRPPPGKRMNSSPVFGITSANGPNSIIGRNASYVLSV